ncbi:hypothetical protein EII14_08880 [Alloprevotella sp. OH1205_COT-284]|nr:hypothetical protein EII14_08880 [Alloprevotella sp. OH1205_COT-284]
MWNQSSKEKAKAVLMEWIEQAKNSKVIPLKVMAKTIMAYRSNVVLNDL